MNKFSITKSVEVSGKKLWNVHEHHADQGTMEFMGSFEKRDEARVKVRELKAAAQVPA